MTPTPPAPMDEVVRQRVRTDLDTNLCVEAGAGTGKTTLLVDRIFNLIVTGRAEIEQIVAVTFTEKAAAELKLRIREKLEKQRIEAAGQNSHQTRLLGRALEKLDQAPISTIHGFASSILRERPVEAGVDPRFEVLDNLTQEFFFEHEWQDWINANLEKHREIFQRAISLGLRIQDIRALAENFYRNRDILPSLSFEAPPVDLPPFLDRLSADLRELAEILPSCLETQDKGYQRIRAMQRSLESFQALGEPQLLEQFLVREFVVKVEGAQKNWTSPQPCKIQKEICRSLQSDLGELRQRVKTGLVHQVGRIIQGFIEEIQAKKNSLGLLDFQDLLLRCRNLLQSNLAVREYFQRRFRYLLIDEFQDTDPLQVEMVFFLAEAQARADDWTRVELKPGKLLLVGDPKQSIYRFRRADIAIYEAAKKHLCKGNSGSPGEQLDIQQNFRSCSGLIEWVNPVFDQLIHPSEGEKYSPEYLPIYAWPESDFESSAPARVVEITADYDPKAKIDEVRGVEAQAVVHTIAEMVSSQWPVRDGKERRPVAFRDMALLFPTYTGMQIYEDALKRAGIPYVLEGGKQYYQRQEVTSLIACLLAIDNPSDQLSIAGALHSIFFGISDRDLFSYFVKNKTFNYLEEKVAVSPVSEALEILRSLHEKRHRHQISGTIRELYEKTCVLETLTFYPHLKQAIANLLKVVQQARDYEHLGKIMARAGEAPVAVFHHFVRWLDQLEQEEVEEMDSLLSESEDNAVRLMSIHKSKGLEFPVVFLMKLHGAFYAGGQFFLDYADKRLEYRLGTQRTGYFQSAGFRELSEREQERLEAERQRILYVAATRARDYLLVPRFVGARPTGYAQFLDSIQMPEVPEIRYTREELTKPVKVDTTFSEPLDHDWEDYRKHREEWSSNLHRALEKGREPSLRIVTATGLKEAKLPDSTWQTTGTSATNGGKAKEMGLLVHRLLEHWNFAEELPENIDGKVLFFLESFINTGLRKRARTAKRHWKELPFSVLVDGDLHEGVIDLVIEEDDGLVLVDYKTDRVANEQEAGERLDQAYRGQGEFYRRALEGAGLEVKEVLFAFLGPGCVLRLLPA